jgi:hypothetical protein
MGIRIGCVGIDTGNVAGAAAFWQGLTGYEVASSDDSYASLSDPAKAGVDLFIQLVPEQRVGKNRLHLDLLTNDLPGEVARAQSLGATEVKRFVGDDGSGWVVLADTDGNQFCIVAD